MMMLIGRLSSRAGCRLKPLTSIVKLTWRQTDNLTV
ncbi:hypothetical protein SY94_6120 (plasmid) [Agrobacterium tumefaciens]|nr:hypothetical protein SY94_6120 [Agrobacterium tumefaciens]